MRERDERKREREREREIRERIREDISESNGRVAKSLETTRIFTIWIKEIPKVAARSACTVPKVAARRACTIPKVAAPERLARF